MQNVIRHCTLQILILLCHILIPSLCSYMVKLVIVCIFNLPAIVVYFGCSNYVHERKMYWFNVIKIYVVRNKPYLAGNCVLRTMFLQKFYDTYINTVFLLLA